MQRKAPRHAGLFLFIIPFFSLLCKEGLREVDTLPLLTSPYRETQPTAGLKDDKHPHQFGKFFAELPLPSRERYNSGSLSIFFPLEVCKYSTPPNTSPYRKTPPTEVAKGGITSYNCQLTAAYLLKISK